MVWLRVRLWTRVNIDRVHHRFTLPVINIEKSNGPLRWWLVEELIAIQKQRDYSLIFSLTHFPRSSPGAPEGMDMDGSESGADSESDSWVWLWFWLYYLHLISTSRLIFLGTNMRFVFQGRMFIFFRSASDGKRELDSNIVTSTTGSCGAPFVAEKKLLTFDVFSSSACSWFCLSRLSFAFLALPLSFFIIYRMILLCLPFQCLG